MYRAYFIGISLVLLAGVLTQAVPVVHAQSVGSTDPLTLDVEPMYPVPYQTVSVTPESSTFDLSDSSITVTVNGVAFFKGTGSEAVQIPLGGPGTSAHIVVTATNLGQTYTKDVTLLPASVALVTEADSTTHPFYAGASLVDSNGAIRLVAIPDLRTSAGKQLDPASLEYSWKLGDQILEDDSGIGKNVIDATAPPRYQDADITVTVSSQDGSLSAQAETTVSPVDPLTLIYLNDPLMGPLYDNAISNSTTMSDVEDTYRGVGYYFSGTPTLAWTVNGVQDGTDQDITVRATGDGQGSATLGFTATGSSDTTQIANSTLSVIFGQKASGIFGL